jgi:hypothetical protein
MKKLIILTILISSCASVRPGPMVDHPIIKDDETKAQDIVICEREASGERGAQQKCLEKKGYSIIGWN